MGERKEDCVVNPKWSPHAKGLLADILQTIIYELSEEDATRWNHRIQTTIDQLGDFPYLSTEIPPVCFQTIPENIDRLRQTFCGPYRIVYEPIDDEIHILSIRHARMLIAEGDTNWS